ncbi:MAG: kinase/pyrophosphorylase [Anaerolineae bacterium]|nr:kinase/pyrophosphorylase [Anaerolineae bacterium]
MKQKKTCCPPIYVVSGGMGVSGEQLVRTALAQFEGAKVEVSIVPHVRQMEQIETVVEQAASNNGLIIHTLVDVDLRQAMMRLARDRNVVAIDPMGRLLSHLAHVLGQEPVGQPGLYRQLRQDYFERVEAIEFTMQHDDGLKPDGWLQAEIVLLGVSRTGKTPLSMYLAVRGWKVANVPLVKEIPPPPQLFLVDCRRVVGLTIDPGQLISHRQQRQRRLGVQGESAYTDPAELYEEVKAARQLFCQNGFAIVDVTDKPIEECADEVIALMNRRLKVKTLD